MDNPNRYAVFHDEIHAVIWLRSGEAFLVRFDPCDLPLYLSGAWVVIGHGRARNRPYLHSTRTRQAFHRIVMGLPKGMLVDHRNNDSLDNRRANLRICTHEGNSRNIGKNKNNTSGATGVIWVKAAKKKWRAYIKASGILRQIGNYETFDEAVAARKAAEIQLHGEFAACLGARA